MQARRRVHRLDQRSGSSLRARKRLRSAVRPATLGRARRPHPRRPAPMSHLTATDRERAGHRDNAGAPWDCGAIACVAEARPANGRHVILNFSPVLTGTSTSVEGQSSFFFGMVSNCPPQELYAFLEGNTGDGYLTASHPRAAAPTPTARASAPPTPARGSAASPLRRPGAVRSPGRGGP